MKVLSVITLLTLLSISCAHEAKNQSSPNSTSDTITPAFLKQEEAALLLQKEDEHIRRWSSFDLASHTVGIEGGKQGYLQFAGAQTRNWNDEETALLRKSSQLENPLKVAPLIQSNLTPVKFFHSFILFILVFFVFFLSVMPGSTLNFVYKYNDSFLLLHLRSDSPKSSIRIA